MCSDVNDLLRRRNDPGYLNWLAVGDALTLVRDGLQIYAENKMKELHALITTNVGGPAVKCTCSCTPGKKSKLNPHGRTTPCIWTQELQNFHNFSNKNDIPWHQSLSSQWHDPVHGYWEIAKLFMCDLGKNWATVKDHKSTDVGALLNLLRFCKHFKIQYSSLDAVKDWRNKCAHAPERTISDIDKQNAFKDIECLLNDPELAGIKEVQDCLCACKRVEMADISILQNDELKIIQEFSRESQIETQAEVREVAERIDNLENNVNKLLKGIEQVRYVLLFIVLFAVNKISGMLSWFSMAFHMFSEVGERTILKGVEKVGYFLLFIVSIVRKIPGMLSWSLMAIHIFSQVGERTLIIDYGKYLKSIIQMVVQSLDGIIHCMDGDFSNRC